MSETNAVTLHPSVVVAWLRNEADSNGEDGNIDSQNMLHKMADDIEQLYDPAIYGDSAVVQPSNNASTRTACTHPHRWTNALGGVFCKDCGARI